MEKSRTEAKKSIEQRLSERKKERDADGRTVIHMTVNDDDEFLSVFSANDTPVISEEVAEFLENSTASLLPRQPLTLKIHSDCIDEAEQELYAKAIKEYYAEKYISQKWQLRKNAFVVGLLVAVGVLTLALSLLIEYHFESVIWAEVTDIIAWVLIWEATHIGVFQNRGIRLQKMRYLSYMDMKIKYLDLQETK